MASYFPWNIQSVFNNLEHLLNRSKDIDSSGTSPTHPQTEWNIFHLHARGTFPVAGMVPKIPPWYMIREFLFHSAFSM
jgi:hypothetical protein